MLPHRIALVIIAYHASHGNESGREKGHQAADGAAFDFPTKRIGDKG